MMEKSRADKRSMALVSSTMFRLLPLQIVLASIDLVNDIVSSLFAGNAVGPEAMAAIGLYSPVATLVLAITLLLVTGSQIMTSRHFGRNQVDDAQGVFMLNIALAITFGLAITALHLLAALIDAPRFITSDPKLRIYLKQYLLGRSIGMVPVVLCSQLSMFLSLENQSRRTTIASIVFIVANVFFQYLFVARLRWEAFGLALACSCSSWVFFAVLMGRFVSGRSFFRIDPTALRWKGTADLCKLGAPDAMYNVLPAARAIVLNALIAAVAGTAGLSSYATVFTVACFFWVIADGMAAVTRLMIGVSVGEEDRQTLENIFHVILRRFVPLLILEAAAISLFASPITSLYYRDPASDVFRLTVLGLRIIPWSIPLNVVVVGFSAYANTMGKRHLVSGLTFLDSFFSVLAITVLLMSFLQMGAVYASYVLRSFVSFAFVVFCVWHAARKFPRNVLALLDMHDDFGASDEDRLDLNVRSMDDVVVVSQQVRAFCEEKGVDARRTFLSGLCLEEMAGNVVDHGFTKGSKRHSVDIRVVYKGEDLILRVKDDCKPFDPIARKSIANPEDKASNNGIRMITSMASEVNYQQILGMNVLTMRV